MRRIVLITAVALVVGACTKESSPIAPGLLIGEIRVGAQPGSVSVSVETTGRWKVCVDGTAGWVGTDVICGKDNGAFTLNYDSNTSDMSDIRPSRRARILLITEEQSRCDTLLLSQRGFGSNLPSCKVSDAPGVKIEFQVPALRTMEIAYCSAAGLETESALAQWASSFDVVACGDHFLEPEAGTPIPGADASVITFGGINFVAADFSSSENKDAMFRELLEQTINTAGAGADCRDRRVTDELSDDNNIRSIEEKLQDLCQNDRHAIKDQGYENAAIDHVDVMALFPRTGTLHTNGMKLLRSCFPF